MKLYDKIWVPDEDGDHEVCDIYDGTPEIGSVSPKVNLIVLTIQDLQDLWNAAQDRACALQIGDPGNTKIFEAYLESKGIAL